MHHLGVLHLNTPRAATLANRLQALWMRNTTDSQPPYRVTLQAASRDHRPLRRQFEQLFNITQSRSRAHYLQQTLGQRIVSEPRPRGDLQALILFTDAAQAAIVNPLLPFYDLRLPVFGSSLMMPKNPDKDQINRDLAGIQFPAFPALLRATNTTPLQQWGSDALSLLLETPPRGSCLNGATGKLFLDRENRWDRRLMWVKYDLSGHLKEADTP